MANDKLPTEVKEPTSDLDSYDMDRIQSYVDRGLPGLTTLEESKASRMAELYLEGKTYRQISKIMRIPKDLILFLSYRHGWFLMRSEYQKELVHNMMNRIMDAKLSSQDHLLEMIHFFQHKFKKNIHKHLATGDDSFRLDTKEVGQYLKALETLNKLTSAPAPKGKTPAIGLNLGDGVTITKTGDDSVEITPKQKTVGDMLKHYADARRDEVNQIQKKKSDIDEEKSSEGDVNEKN